MEITRQCPDLMVQESTQHIKPKLGVKSVDFLTNDKGMWYCEGSRTRAKVGNLLCGLVASAGLLDPNLQPTKDGPGLTSAGNRNTACQPEVNRATASRGPSWASHALSRLTRRRDENREVRLATTTEAGAVPAPF